MKRHVTTVLVLSVLALAAVPAIAAAGKGEPYPLPTPKSYAIDAPANFGGVKIGMTLNKAEKRWGGNGRCGRPVLPDSCFWGSFAYSNEGRAELMSTDGIVDFVSIGWSGLREDGRPVIRREIARFETGKGIGLTSKMSDVGKKYPDAERFKKPTGRVQAYRVSEGGISMQFGGGDLVEYITMFPTPED